MQGKKLTHRYSSGMEFSVAAADTASAAGYDPVE